jgi:hypothetical protein
MTGGLDWISQKMRAGKVTCAGDACGLTCDGSNACGGGYCCAATSCATGGNDQCP